MKLRGSAQARGEIPCRLRLGISGTGRRLTRTGAALGLAALLGIAGQARAENECGPPEAGREVVCTPSTYDPAEGNIFYGHDENGEDETSGDFTVRLGGELSIDYDRERPGDDVYVSPSDDQDRRYGAVLVSPGEFGEYAGDVSLYSSASVTSNGIGIFAGHYGKSGTLRMEMSGGDIATSGAGSHAVDSFRSEGSDGALDLMVRGVTIDTTGVLAFGVSAEHMGEGVLNLTMQDIAVSTAGDWAVGVRASHDGAGELNIDAQNLVIKTAGHIGIGVISWHQGEGELNIEAQDLVVETAGAHADGVYGSHQGKGELALTAEELVIETAGDDADGVSGTHEGEGELNIEAQILVIETAGANARGVYGLHQGEGELAITAEEFDIVTAGDKADGVSGTHAGEGELKIDTRNLVIETAGANARGVYGLHQGEGELAITAEELDIVTAGDEADGVSGTHAGEGELKIDTRNLVIETAGANARGVYGLHQGEGELALTAEELDIVTAGDLANGVFGVHESAGDLKLDARNLDITTRGANARGVYGLHQREGELAITAENLDIVTAGGWANGVLGVHESAGDLKLDARNLDIVTTGDIADGLIGWRRGEGELKMDARNLDIATAGASARGVFGGHQGAGELALTAENLDIATAGASARGVFGIHLGAGELALTAEDLDIVTAGTDADGVRAQHRGAGDLNLDVRGVSITTTGAGASGIYGDHFAMGGDVAVRVRDGAVSTAGADAFGVRGFHAGPGALDVDLRETSVATAGEGSHGVVINRFGSGSARIAVDGGSVHAAGTGASGIRIGFLHEDGSQVFATPIGEDGYRRQSVSVNAPVTGGSGEDAAGVFLAGGGRVAIGPRGRVGAASGVAILASGGASKLSVEMDLDGRRAGDVVGGTIHNDGGETTVVVNGVTLHDGATGVTGAEVVNGARDLSLAASGTIAGRTFAPEDFIESYAPRAAVYEALPGFLLRLDGGRPSGTRIARPGSPAWARVSGGRGSYEPGRASVGAAYDFRRFSAEAGLDLALGENVTGSLSLRHVGGTAEVASPYGGGEIEARGVGVAAGLSWSGADGYYGRGRLAFTNYEVDVSSRKRGSLARDVGARGHSLGIEAGRRIAVGETVTLTPRAWAAHRRLSGGAFTDAVSARVSLDKSTRHTGGIGLSAETERALEDGALTLRASADVERALGGADTVAAVSGERLESEASATRVLLGLGGTLHKGRLSLGAQLGAGGPGSGDTQYSGRITLGWTF